MEKLLDLFQRFSKLVTEAFNEDPRFLTARDKAYKQVVNDTQVFKLELPSKTVRLLKVRILYFVYENVILFRPYFEICLYIKYTEQRKHLTIELT